MHMNRRTHTDPDRVYGLYAAGALALALIFGGGTGKWYASDAVIIVAAAVLWIWSVSRLHGTHLSLLAKTGTILFAVAAGLQALHILPVPYDLWASLPGHMRAADILGAADIKSAWPTLSIAPWNTFFGLAAFIVPFAFYLTTLSLPSKGLNRLTLIILVGAIFSSVLGILQMIQGIHSPLRFYSFTNPERPVGIFANTNHLACLMAIAIPLAFERFMQSTRKPVMRIGWGVAIIVFLYILLATYSKAGLALAAVAVAASLLPFAINATRGSKKSYLLLFAIVLGVIAFFIQFGLSKYILRFGSFSTDDRTMILKSVMTAAKEFFPLGSGFGTAETAIAMHEPPSNMSNAIVNQAHNDWVQIWLEGGIPATMILVAFLIWLGFAIRAQLRSENLNLTRLSVIVSGIVVVLLHSFVDYPMRTLAIQVCFAVFMGMLVRPLATQRRRRRG
jgi:O-antigen ligase